jgi:2-keto-4-pentenoate hydratase/2-oxohepta-3-ene-1,7-dioic acid hydratase in catechol pathway
MKFLRYEQHGSVSWGWYYEDKIGKIDGNIFENYRRFEANIHISDVKLMPAASPTKIICIGRNYASHAAEHKVDVPEIPLIFLKPPSSLIGNNEKIFLPPQSNQVEHEAELGIIIGKRGRWIDPDSAEDYIFGYTIANDVTARDLQRLDGQWTRGKGFDTFCPVGPYIETEFDPSDALITCKVNQQVRQMGSTRDMVFPVEKLIAFVSSVMTLEPGDLILTGTPAGVGVLCENDIVEIKIEGLGVLKNFVSSNE